MEYLCQVRQPLSAYLKRYQTELIWPTGVPYSDLVVEALHDRDFHVFSWLMSQAFPDFGRYVSAMPLESLPNQAIMDEMMNHASSGDHNDVMKWMLDNGFHITEAAMAFIEDSPDIMASIDWSHDTILYDAAFRGHMNCVRYAASAGITFTRMMCCAAATGGQLEMLKYLREQGCPWSGELILSCTLEIDSVTDQIYDSISIHEAWGHLWTRRAGIRDCMEYARSNGLTDAE